MPHRESPATNRASSEPVRAGQHQDTTEDPVHVGPTLLDHLDHLEGLRRKETGMDQARHGEAIGIVAAIEDEVIRLAATGETFLPDDVLPDLASRKAVGPVFNRLRRNGVIEIVGTATSTRPERHGALTRCYRGVGGGADA